MYVLTDSLESVLLVTGHPDSVYNQYTMRYILFFVRCFSLVLLAFL